MSTVLEQTILYNKHLKSYLNREGVEVKVCAPIHFLQLNTLFSNDNFNIFLFNRFYIAFENCGNWR